MRWARAEQRVGSPRAFDIALGHGSNDVTVAAALLRIPSATMFDYEWATVQHNVNCRLARAVVVPDAIPPERLDALRREGQGARVRGPQGGVLPGGLRARRSGARASSASTATAPIVVVRTPPEVSLYHRFENDLFARVLDRLAAAAAEQGVQPVVLPRVASQREELARVPGFVVPEHAIDAQSLIAHADLVISAGGTMNREAVALGTPVYTTFEGRLGAVDERLIAERPPAHARRAARSSTWAGARARTPRRRVRRDPRVLVELLLSPSRADGLRRGLGPDFVAGPTICPMRRRIRSAALPLHRHSLPQLAVDGALVALAYYLAFQLRFTSGPAVALRATCAARHDLVGARGEPAGAGPGARLPAPLALRRPARLRGGRARGRG